MITHDCYKCHRKTYIYSFRREFCYFCCDKTPTKKRFSKNKCFMCQQLFASNKKTKKYCEECRTLPKACKLDPWFYLKNKFNNTCQRCGKFVPKRQERWSLHIHHYIPKRFGGTDDESNLRCLCHGCHAHIHRYPSKYPKYIKIPSEVTVHPISGRPCKPHSN